VSPLTFVGNRIDRLAVSLVSRHAFDALKRRYGPAAAHRDTGCHLPSRAIAVQPGGGHAEQPFS
jgi:hypothetical protein